MDFIKKNFVTVLVVGATVVLAGVAMFTAMRLYQLRQNPVTPAEPASTPGASDAPITVRPASGNWNLPESYIITNTSSTEVSVVWNVDCWDENLCEDSSGTEILAAGDTFEKGLGALCSQWQLQLNWSGTQTEQNDVWDWSGVAELGSECDVDIASTEEDVVDEEVALEEATESAITTSEVSSDMETIACTTLAFTLEEAPVGGTATLTPVPSATVKPTATATPKASAIASASATVKPIVTAKPELPAAGVSVPTVVGISAGAILLLFALGLAL